MPYYEYYCGYCGDEWDEHQTIDFRDEPCYNTCKKCGELAIERKVAAPAIKVPEGGCGNAANGYSSFHGDSENFKAGRKIYK